MSLDLALIGYTPAEVEAEITIAQHVTDAQRDLRRRLVAKYEAEPDPRLTDFRVSYIVTTAARHPPAALGDRVRLVKRERTWALWRVEPPPGGGSPAPNRGL